LSAVPSVLISGANRGLGLEFARQYAADGWVVHATARNPAAAHELAGIGEQVHVHQLDIADERSIHDLAKSLICEPLDVLIVNSGIHRDFELPVETIGRQDFLSVFAVNTFGPLALASALLPNLERGERKLATAMSSLMSSITRNDWGTQHVYRASKTALNAVWTSLAREWQPRGIACVLIRPGYVRTALTKYQGDLDPPESVRGLRNVIAGLSLADSGRLIGYDGLDLPW
jgi:NAD(P)-dependent dehydrogenase (short-subunit alcohol dehydrogenase family)